jgi:hypothetical protein
MADRLYIYVFISSSLFTSSNWFTFDGGGGIDDRLLASVPSSSPNYMETSLEAKEADDVIGTGVPDLPSGEVTIDLCHTDDPASNQQD